MSTMFAKTKTIFIERNSILVGYLNMCPLNIYNEPLKFIVSYQVEETIRIHRVEQIDLKLHRLINLNVWVHKINICKTGG